jgi:hypothetical protein
MQNDFHEDDPRTIWQNQPTEASKMSLLLIRQKARQLQAQARRQMLGTLAVPFIVAFFYTFCIKQFPQLQQLVHPLFAVALAWSLAGLYFLNGGKRPPAMPEDAGFTSGLEFCRREISRQGTYFRRVLLWSFGPVVLSLGTVVLALAIVARGQMFAKGALPFTTLAAVWIVAYLAIWVRQRREHQREIDELSEVDK